MPTPKTNLSTVSADQNSVAFKPEVMAILGQHAMKTIDQLTREEAVRIIRFNENGNDQLEGNEALEELLPTIRGYLTEEGQDESGELWQFLLLKSSVH